MLKGALQKHELQSASKTPAPLSPSDLRPSERGQPIRGSSFFNHERKPPLKPASASALNTLRSSQQSGPVGGMKRTASGLAKVVDCSFEEGIGAEHNPIVLDGGSLGNGGIVQITHDDFINEDDFDSDVDLEIEEPVAKKAAIYPSLSQHGTSVSARQPDAYSTLSRHQYAQKHSEDVDAGHASARPGIKEAPDSSAPVPWSSSPAEHYSSALKKDMIKDFTFNPFASKSKSATQHFQNGPPPPSQAQPKPAKGRVLPWIDEQAAHASAPEQPSRPSNIKARSDPNSTPLPKDSKKSTYLWNTTSSAVKEQQKKHREEVRKSAALVKNTDGEGAAIQKAKSSRQRPPRIYLSQEQQQVLDLVVDEKKSVFFTGSAGTGKSVLMREIISSLRKRYQREPDRVAVTASTGLAACNVGGVTLHSFAGIGLGKEDVPVLVSRIKKNQKAKGRWLRTKVLIVDEVSMVDGDLFDKLEAIARQLRNNGRPFGGIQLVITGDFFQLPPVPDQGRIAKFAFDAATWNTSVEYTIGLHHVFRQKDPIFAGMLNEMREGRLSESSVRAFRSLSRPLNFEDTLEATELFPTRSEVERANHERLAMLQGTHQVFDARDGGAIVDQAQRQKLLQNCMAPESITLKKGAQVMLIKNVDEGLVNGSLGRVIGFMSEQQFDSYTNDEDGFAKTQGGSIATTSDTNLAPEEARKKRLMEGVSTTRRWPSVRFVLADGTSRDLLCQPEMWKVELPNGEIQASRQQVPLILAWALSIHKAQGQTLERVKVDLGKVFEKGQAYVALSRATSMAGLQVMRFDPKKVNAHERVRTFYSNLSKVESLGKNGKKKDRAGTTAQDYEKTFVDDKWGDSF